jgi:hypothetical protein
MRVWSGSCPPNCETESPYGISPLEGENASVHGETNQALKGGPLHEVHKSAALC